MENNYPNLMCFGNEPHKCNCQNSCSNYKECEKRYYEVWFSFMEADHIKEWGMNMANVRKCYNESCECNVYGTYCDASEIVIGDGGVCETCYPKSDLSENEEE